MRKYAGIAAITFVGLAACSRAAAQADFTSVKIKPGDVIYVTEPSGVEVSGRLGRLSAAELSIDGYTFRPGPGLKIERRGDSIWDGAAAGFVGGTFVLYPIIPTRDRGESVRPLNGLAYGLLGALIDYSIKGRTTVYDSSNAPRTGAAVWLVPRVGRRRVDLQVTISRQ